MTTSRVPLYTNEKPYKTPTNNQLVIDSFQHFLSLFILYEKNKAEENQNSGDGSKMMHMTFYWSIKVTLLFDSWKTDSWTSYSLTLLACLVASIFYQYMENRRIQFKLLASSAAKSGPAIETSLLRNKLVSKGVMSPVRVAGSVLFGVNSAIGYMLMLAVMSFNGGVFVAVVVGLAIGYWFFRSGDEDGVVVVDNNSCACA